MWVALSDGGRVYRLQLQLVLASAVILGSESRPYFTASDSIVPQPAGPGPRVYISQEQGGPVIPPGSGFTFHRRAIVEVFEPASTRESVGY
jgi:hypothetical protein